MNRFICLAMSSFSFLLNGCSGDVKDLRARIKEMDSAAAVICITWSNSDAYATRFVDSIIDNKVDNPLTLEKGLRGKWCSKLAHEYGVSSYSLRPNSPPPESVEVRYRQANQTVTHTLVKPNQNGFYEFVIVWADVPIFTPQPGSPGDLLGD